MSRLMTTIHWLKAEEIRDYWRERYSFDELCIMYPEYPEHKIKQCIGKTRQMPKIERVLEYTS